MYARHRRHTFILRHDLLRLFYCLFSAFFFFNDTATTEIYTLSLHDALPISVGWHGAADRRRVGHGRGHVAGHGAVLDGNRKSTRLNSSHSSISYAVFCLKKTKNRTKKSRSYRSTLTSHDQQRIVSMRFYSRN